MAEVRPFRGIRYDESIDLEEVVSPPYDVLTAAQAGALRARSPYNAAHIDLPVDPGSPADDAAYERAAGLFRSWQAGGALAREAEPAVYLVDQTYRGPDGVERTRHGLVARLTLADLADRVVLPHEKTHASAKLDRLRLLRATHADLSQVFLLFPDDDGAVAEQLAAAQAGAGGGREAHDADGNRHSIVPLAGAVAERICGLLRDRSLYIADGHHRYETALAYRDERRAAGDATADTQMVYLCSMSDPGLMVFPTHRLVKGLEVPPMDEVLRRLAPAFTVHPGTGAGHEACELMARGLPGAAGDATAFVLYFPREDACRTIALRGPEALAGLRAEGFTDVAAGLAVTVLHYLIFRDALGIDPDDSEHHIEYVIDPAEAHRRLAGGGYGLGAFINPTLVSEVRAIADRGETMPQKSTYFYPKLLTGLVFDALGES